MDSNPNPNRKTFAKKIIAPPQVSMKTLDGFPLPISNNSPDKNEHEDVLEEYFVQKCGDNYRILLRKGTRTDVILSPCSYDKFLRYLEAKERVTAQETKLNVAMRQLISSEKNADSIAVDYYFPDIKKMASEDND